MMKRSWDQFPANFYPFFLFLLSIINIVSLIRSLKKVHLYQCHESNLKNRHLANRHLAVLFEVNETEKAKDGLKTTTYYLTSERTESESRQILTFSIFEGFSL